MPTFMLYSCLSFLIPSKTGGSDPTSPLPSGIPRETVFSGFRRRSLEGSLDRSLNPRPTLRLVEMRELSWKLWTATITYATSINTERKDLAAVMVLQVVVVDYAEFSR
mmetsp:Transcript_6691/g.15284  ORF Transcript_6691/g.15284 Transcript_6691/m.15284 type:complete len:108 (+) Transcript_6691:280-603(+)